MRPPSPAVVRMRCGGSAVRVQNSMAEVKLVNVKKIYPFVSGEEKKSKKKKKGEEPAEEKKVNLQITDKGVVAVQEFNLDIADKEFIVLVGPSGCGKSTTLRMVAGLEEISEGELYIDGKLMNDVAPKDRDIAMVFQNYALYPHMTVYDNMAFSLKLKKTPKAEIDRKVREAAEILDAACELRTNSEICSRQTAHLESGAVTVYRSYGCGNLLALISLAGEMMCGARVYNYNTFESAKMIAAKKGEAENESR